MDEIFVLTETSYYTSPITRSVIGYFSTMEKARVKRIELERIAVDRKLTHARLPEYRITSHSVDN